MSYACKVVLSTYNNDYNGFKSPQAEGESSTIFLPQSQSLGVFWCVRYTHKTSVCVPRLALIKSKYEMFDLER